MQKGQYLEALLRSPKTVFTLKDMALLWGEPGAGAARVRLNDYVRRGKLYRLRRGFFSKDKHYNSLELATRIYTPAYVSFETILVREGIVFQFHTQVSVASYLTRDIEVDGITYSFRKVKTAVLTNSLGIEHRDETSLASKERAFLDTLYLHTGYHFDNLNSLDWDKVFEMIPIYHNQSLADRVLRLHAQMTHPNET